MAKFKQLTPMEGTARIFVNLEAIETIVPQGPFSLIKFSADHIIGVKESPEEILEEAVKSTR
ncbi:hypothetical protein [Bradyrhizobium japonicum]|uniref:hypothetical protein n=1 Tax=Bradyrhizobium japonicum TaxID=375 RepID=UPI001BA777BB|nr:hypothetical protein [Bradyrhizobium japonicum]MBR0760709.1 hypothetical protein [Bradyrhizobium japonicum]